MATKITGTTDNNAGCSPCTPEAHQRADFQNQLKGKAGFKNPRYDEAATKAVATALIA